MNLATVAQVKAYMQWDSNMDALVAALLPRTSDYVRRWLSRALPIQVNTNRRLSGTGSSRLVLPDFPVLSIERVSIDPVGPDLVVSDGLQQGYLFDDWGLYLVGGAVFPAGFLNVVCSWTAGYAAQETATVPTGNTPTLAPSTGSGLDSGVTAAGDRGVTYTGNGTALTAVSGNVSAAGQYSFSETTGVYAFHTGDANQSVTMRYSYVPMAIVQAISEMIGLKAKQRSNLGISSRSIADESVSYDDRDMTDSIKGMLSPYRRVTPV